VDLDVVFLGTSASAPTARRGTSSLLVRRGGDRILFDCGEGTQRQLLRSSVGLVDLEEIYLTHLHADHYLGLPGMLKTFSLRMRETPLTIYGPAGLRDLFDSLRRVFGKLCYRLDLEEVRAGDAQRRDGYEVRAFPVDHGVPAVGYALVEEERPGRFDVTVADTLGVPFGPERGALQRGEAVTLADGTTVTPDQLVGPQRAGRTVVYTGDTSPADAVALLFPGADLLIHESTFGEEERSRASETGHSTARQAAEVAREANVLLLALTHVSPRHLPSELLQEAREVFPGTILPRDFDTVEVPFREKGLPALVKGGAAQESGAATKGTAVKEGAGT
jgi:ribonuclease Z